MWFAYVLVGIAAALVWLGLIDRSFPPWKRIQFPDLEIEFNRTLMNAKDDNEAVWLAYTLRITNRERTQPANLGIYYRGKVAPGELRNIHPRREDWGETPFTIPDGTPPQGFPTDWLAPTVNILPQHTASGYYVAKLKKYWWGALVEPREESLLIVDHVSERAVFVPARIGRGPYNSANWGIPTKDSAGCWTVYLPSAATDEARHSSTEQRAE